ncbi:viral A-type inclusion protein [Reticulomyxa filosa]|uniref:Viral A-type inclusion protein n=1 Tax=Reticulomyxa filosa TaxID=46433 RepID=X6MK39_RETFI|nr:viral A-type inclusion protein [Reticulomyxa filosa]|eukprot:ETO13822.1 viral A-type inclusion protein [Reticulomyxa filosa]
MMKYIKPLEQIANDMHDVEKSTEITDACEFLQKLSGELRHIVETEKKWRFKYSEVSRQLEELQMRRKYEQSHFKKTHKQLQNAFNHEKDVIENKHNALMERLQDELQMCKTANVRLSKFDIESRLEQLEESLTESQMQIRDKDEEIREMTEALDNMTFRMSELEQDNARLQVLAAGVEQTTLSEPVGHALPEKGYEFDASFASELRKCYEIIENLTSTLALHDAPVNGDIDITSQPTTANGKENVVVCSFDITEPTVDFLCSEE